MYRKVGQQMKNCSIRFSFTSYKRTTAILSCCGSKKSSERLQIVASFYSCSYLFASNLCTFYLSNISLFFSIVFFGRVLSYVFRKRFFFFSFCERISFRKHFCLHKSVFQLFFQMCAVTIDVQISHWEKIMITHMSLFSAPMVHECARFRLS